MSDPNTAHVPSPSASVDSRNAFIIYILYLAAFLVGVSALIGVVMAYIHKNNAPEWVSSHYQYQIRTFWIGLLYAVVGGVLVIAVVGWLVLLFWAVWHIVRCVKGMKQLQQGAPIPNPTTWLW
jgi:uncharacterized membrane protein